MYDPHNRGETHPLYTYIPIHYIWCVVTRENRPTHNHTPTPYKVEETP